MEVILLERIKNLGQMGEQVTVKSGYARNFLLPLKKALRANKENIEKFESKKIQLEAQNLETKNQAEKLKDQISGKKFVLIRSAAESGALYGSVTARDIQIAMHDEGVTINKRQIELNTTIKELGIVFVPVNLHPEVLVNVEINVARSAEEAVIQNSKAEGSKDNDQEELKQFFEKEADARDFQDHESDQSADEDSTDKVEDSTDKVEDSTDKVEDSTDKVEDSTDKVEDSTDKVEDSTDKVETSTN